MYTDFKYDNNVFQSETLLNKSVYQCLQHWARSGAHVAEYASLLTRR